MDRAPESPVSRTSRTATTAQFPAVGAPAAGLGRISISGLNRRSRGGIPRRRMRTLGQYALVYLVEGRAYYADAAGRDRDLVPGDLLLLLPELPHAYGAQPGRHWSEFYLVFHGPVFDLWRQAGLISPDRLIHHIEPVDRWLARLQSVPARGTAGGAEPPVLAVARLQQVLAEILVNRADPSANDEQQRWARRACAAIDAELTAGLDMQRIAQAMHCSYETFRKRFTQVVGQSPGRYHAARLIERAGQLMQDSAMSDQQIADALGFCDPFYFSKRFKQLTGQTPRLFRRSLPPQ